MAFSRQVDLLSVSRTPLGSSLELKDYGTWLAQRPRLARPGTPLWSVVQTEAAPSVIEQAAELSGHQAPEPAIDAEALRLLVYQSFSAGARGIEFASNSRLDAGDALTHNRAAALALLNLEMQLLEPWEAAGSLVGNVSSNDPNISGVVLMHDAARLVVAIRARGDRNLCRRRPTAAPHCRRRPAAFHGRRTVAKPMQNRAMAPTHCTPRADRATTAPPPMDCYRINRMAARHFPTAVQTPTARHRRRWPVPG